VYLIVALVCCCQPTAYSQTVATYDENAQHVFLNGDYSRPGAVTVTANSILYDVTPSPTNSSIFTGGSGGLFISPVDFAPANDQVEIRFRVLAGNSAPSMGAVLSDGDPPGGSETWLYDFDLLNHTPADSWITLRQELSEPYLVTSGGDGILNPGLELL